MNSVFMFKVRSLLTTEVPERQWPVPLRGATVGRSTECTWLLNDSNRIVSRLHARVDVDDSHCYWTDLGTNNTQINGKPMPHGQRVRLTIGDVLKIGDYLLTLDQEYDDWDSLGELLPIQKADDPLVSLLPQAPVELNIDDLLAELSSSNPSNEMEDVKDLLGVPVLAQRMYVGSQQGLSNPKTEDNKNKERYQLQQDEIKQLKYLLVISVQGYMQLLQARRIFKEEMGGNLTTISSKANNPLKFSSSPEEALSHLLSESSPAYLPAEQALEQARQDLLEHMQLSVARIQSVVAQVQTTLDPKAIMDELSRAGGLTLGLNAARKARLWDLYCERYQQLGDTWN